MLLVAAGVTFYALLALFPATAALVSLYGLFADPSTINEHLRLASGFLPEGALEVIGDQVRRIASQKGTLGITFIGTLALALWGANAGTKAIFDALNIIYKEREKRSFVGLTLQSLLFTLGAIALMLVALAGIVVVPVVLKLLGIPEASGRRSLACSGGRCFTCSSSSRLRASTDTGQAEPSRSGGGSPGEARLQARFGLWARCCCPGTSPISAPTMPPTDRSGP